MTKLNKNRITTQVLCSLILTLLAASGAGCSSSAGASEERPGLVALEPFLTNINDPFEERYCKLAVKLAVVPAQMALQIEEDVLLVAQLRDLVLTSLMSKSYVDLTAPNGKELLRSEIQTGLNEMLTDAELREVLFSEFVVQ